jgi:hypothetical protein
MVHAVLLVMIIILCLYSSTLLSVCAMSSVVVFSAALLWCLPGMLLGYFMNEFKISCKWPTWCTIPFSICLFQISTCFEQPRAHHQENELYQYNIWYVSLCVGDRLVCRWESTFPTPILDDHLHRVTHTRCCIDTTHSPDDEHEFARNL